MTLNLSSFFTQTSNKENRRIFIGPASFTWTVPDGTTEVEVNVWGGGGAGGAGSPYAVNPSIVGGAGGGGGGYARHLYKVSGGNVLQITVGGQGGTSSVSCPSNPTPQPISATGGSDGGQTVGGSGGTGSISSVPIPLRTGITTSFSGGSGGSGGPGTGAGSGGGAGFIFTNGENGLTGLPAPTPSNSQRGGYSCPTSFISPYPTLNNVFTEGETITANKAKWFYLEELVTNYMGSYAGGNGGSGVTDIVYSMNSYSYPTRNRFLGGAPGKEFAADYSSNRPIYEIYPSQYQTNSSSVAGGGGGGGHAVAWPNPTDLNNWYARPSGGAGGVGAVIIYW